MLRLASPLLWCTFSFPAPSVAVLDYSSLFIVQWFFLGGGVVSLPRGCAGLSWGWLGEFSVTSGAHLLGL
jgi:hypothetical protein